LGYKTAPKNGPGKCVKSQITQPAKPNSAEIW